MILSAQTVPAPVSFLINGVGAMGRGLAHQINATPFATIAGLSDVEPGRAVTCCRWLGLDYRMVETPAEADDAFASGRVAVARDALILAESGIGDLLFEASSAVACIVPAVIRAMDRGRHIVMMNAEADFAFAPLLAAHARRVGVLYSSSDGDQYGVLKRMADEITGWGFDIAMFGNIKGFLDRRANPLSIIAEADLRGLDYRMCAAYTDGTKLNIEMALIANTCGGRPLQAGMIGPRAERVAEVFDLFDFARRWDGGVPLVDYILGAEPGGGVFVVGYSDDPYRRDMMRYYKMGEGPFYLIYRPHHLCHFEAVPSALRMLQDRQPLMQPTRSDTEVIAYSKIPLPAGSRLDGIGGFSCYGLIESSPVGEGLPICLAEGAILNRDVQADERISRDDVDFPDLAAMELYQQAQVLTGVSDGAP